MEKLRNSKDKKIQKLLERLKPGKGFEYVENEKAEFYGPNKPRFVDPLVMRDKGLVRTSSLVPSLSYFYKEFSERYRNLGVMQKNS